MSVLCIDTKAIDVCHFVQKDIRLEELLLNHTKYYDSNTKAERDGYVPLDFCTSVRTVYTNLVLRTAEKTFYINQTKVREFVHKGADLLMYLSAIALLGEIDYCPAFDDLMLKYSHIMPIGIYNPDPRLINPRVYSHVILEDEAAEAFKRFLKSGAEFITIQHMKENHIGCVSALINTIKEVNRDADNDNDREPV